MSDTKSYKLKASAARAARQAGMVDGQFEIYESKGKEGKKEITLYHWRPTEAHTTVKTQMEEHKVVLEKKYPESKKKEVIEEPVKKLLIVDETAGEKVPEEYKLPEPTPLPPEKTTIASKTSGQPQRVTKEVAAKEKPEDGRIHKSRVQSPTKLVWHIADEMTAADSAVTRRQVIEECTRRGIAFYTARTQYQQWLTACRESEANSRKINDKNKTGKK
jgi:hypothetical protein